MSEKRSEPRLEAALTRLEQLATKLDSDTGTLEDALKDFEEGIHLASQCLKYLDETELRIEKLHDSLTRQHPEP